jgi:alpha-L-arabinofuranosidase
MIGPVPGVPGSSIQSSENPILPFGPVATGWGAVGNVSLGLTLLHPLSDALPVVLEMGTLFRDQYLLGFANFR